MQFVGSSLLTRRRPKAGDGCERYLLSATPVSRWTLNTSLRKLRTDFLNLFVGLQPSGRLIVHVDYLNPVTPRVAEIAPKWRNHFQSVFLRNLLTDLGDLGIVTHHKTEVPVIVNMRPIGMKEREELVIAELEKGIPLPFTLPFQIEDIGIEFDRSLEITDLENDVVAAKDVNRHWIFSFYFRIVDDKYRNQSSVRTDLTCAGHQHK